MTDRNFSGRSRRSFKALTKNHLLNLRLMHRMSCCLIWLFCTSSIFVVKDDSIDRMASWIGRIAQLIIAWIQCFTITRLWFLDTTHLRLTTGTLLIQVVEDDALDFTATKLFAKSAHCFLKHLPTGVHVFLRAKQDF